MNSDHNAPPLNPLPPIVWLMALPLIGVELAIQLQSAGLLGAGAAMGWREAMFRHVMLLPEMLRLQWETGGHPVNELYRLVSYALVHASFSDTLFATVLFLALGKAVGEILHWWAMLVVVFCALVAGGLAHGLLVPGLKAPLVGAYPAVYGLIGAFTSLIFSNLARVGASKYRAFSLIGFLMAVQLIFALVFGGNWKWVAELSGFAAGFLVTFLVAPGGFKRIREQIRQR
jgi:membrane associated rhomboid family serine protease